MSDAPDIIFYAPMKPPDHPVPSGDRTMARLLLKALERAGFKSEIITRFQSFENKGDPAAQEALRRAAENRAQKLIEILRMRPQLPRLWFSYHVYYKSPDWIGPIVSDALGIPYVVAEGSRAMKRAAGNWAIGHRGAEKALNAARIIFAMTALDEEALRAHRPEGQNIISLPPFLDADEWPWPDIERSDRPAEGARLLTVAMIRPGDKLRSYAQLANALHRVTQPWSLDIVGDGVARPWFEESFHKLGGTVCWHGEVTEKAALAKLYCEADLLVWPAVNEAYGMVFLEAQAFGCPVIAGNHGGVASVIRNGETGILTAPNDTNALAAGIDALISDRKRLQTFGANAQRFVREERSLDSAACILANTLLPLMERAAP